MNLRVLTAIVSLVGLTFLLSCGEDEGDDNNEIFDPTSQYYIQFKANGDLKTYEADGLSAGSTAEMVQCIIPPTKDEFAGITLTNRSFEIITAAQIESWANTTFTVASTEPHPIFFFLGKDFYSSDEGENPALTLSITRVEFIGTQQIEGESVQRIYKVTGTFSGKVTNVEKEKTLKITNGRFVVEFLESVE